MQRIQGPTATIDNQFTEGNPSLNIPATIVSGNWLNATQEEIAQSVERGAVGLDAAKQNQIGDFITEYSRPFNMLVGFGINTGVGPVTTFTPAVHGDYIATGWAFTNGLAQGSPNPVSANIYVNGVAECIECEGTGTIGDFFEIENTDPTLFGIGQNGSAEPSYNARGSAAILPNNSVTKSAICTVYGGGVPVELSLITADGIIYNKTQNVNNGETKQAVTIQKNAANYGNFKLRVKLLQSGSFKVNLGGFCAFWGANKLPPYTLDAPYGSKLAQAARRYQKGTKGKHYVPCKFASGGGGASNYANGFCDFNFEMYAISVVSITNLSVSAITSTGGSDMPAPAASIIITQVYKNGFEYVVSSGLTTSTYTALEIKFDWKAWIV
jgi:hypothetical protein